MGNNIILETKFVADIRGSFYIPSYQRGYRWSETEVVRLLDDIYQNGKKNYCLQPVVVRKKEDQYELIDGQQRLTTLYLIYKYMKNVNPFFNEPAFTLSYQTRDQSEEFLKTLDMTKQDDNIDFWFISKAYNTIKEWFEQDLQIRVMPYLKEADDDHLSRDEMGQYLVYDDVYIVCENNSYGVYRNDDDSLTDTVTISQNEAGIDTEDRIIKLKKYIANMK